MDEFEKHNCSFKNEAECEEELDDEGLSLDEELENHFQDEGDN